ncbi:hypothetical protein ACWGII_23235 [Streptomyces sp. NPDC054855]
MLHVTAQRADGALRTFPATWMVKLGAIASGIIRFAAPAGDFPVTIDTAN